VLFAALAATAIGTWVPWLTPGAHATRYMAPLALIALSVPPPRERMAEWVLRAAASATFLCHGIEALLAHSQFIDYIITGGQRLGIEFAESSARAMLFVIGVVDVAVAAAILLPKRLRAVAAWMAAWGLTTAVMRTVYLGWGAWPETLIRVTNGAVPLTLLLLWGRKN
jgi:hypothetical protein